MRARSLLFSALAVLAAVALTSAQEADQQIVDGDSVDDADLFPWFALYDGDSGSVICGGVLISKNRILTSARCISNKAPGAVRIGGTNEDNGEKIAVSCAKRHPNYAIVDAEDDFSVRNDLAVLYLAANSSKTPIDSINTDVGYPSVKGTEFVTMGYGLTTQIDWPDDDDDRRDRRQLKDSEDDDGLPEDLQAIVEEYKSLEDCQDKYPKDVIVQGLHKCMKVKDGGGCSGDQGGPVVDMHEKLVGILSFAYGCADNDYYDVFVDVAQYSGWINERIYDKCNTDKVQTPAPTPAPTKPCTLDQIATDRIVALKDRISAVGGFIKARISGGGDGEV